MSLLFGVPKGSVLGFMLFTVYTKPFGTIAQFCGVKYHLYADVALDSGNKALENLEHCITDIQLWMINYVIN